MKDTDHRARHPVFNFTIKGQFIWEDKLYNETHAPLINAELFEQVQSVFRGHNKPKYRSHDIAFSGLPRCAYDNCTVTAELKKNR